MAKYKVKTIEFDFSDSFGEDVSEAYQEKIIKETLERTWLADDEEDLVDAISEEYSWCVSAIEYEEIIKETPGVSVDGILSFGDIGLMLRGELSIFSFKEHGTFLNNEILSVWEEQNQ